MDSSSVLDMLAGALKARAALNGVDGGRPVPVRMQIVSGGMCYDLHCERLMVTPARELLTDLGQMVGRENVQVLGGMPIVDASREQRRGYRNGNGNGRNGNGSTRPNGAN